MTASNGRHLAPPTVAVLCLLLALGACRTGVPLVDANPGPPVVMGTITGNVSGEDGTTPVPGRKVTAVNLDTSAREAVMTSETGGYTFKLPAGRYRVEVELLPGEAATGDTGEFKLSRSELQHDVDIRIGPRRAPVTRNYQPPLDNSAPIA